MLKRIILLLLISSIALTGFAQKNKRKSVKNAPKNTYFEMLIDGSNTPKEIYCPGDTIIFDFAVLDTNIKKFTYCWANLFPPLDICDSTPIKLAFPITAPYPYVSTYKIELRFTIPTDDNPILDTLTTEIKVDYIRTILDTMVCYGKGITVISALGKPITYTNVQNDIYTPWDTLQSVSGCDSLVCWYIKSVIFRDTLHGYEVCQGRDIIVITVLGKSIEYTNVQNDITTPPDTLHSVLGCDSLVYLYIKMKPYIPKEYSISSCDSIIWGKDSLGKDIIIRRPDGHKGDYTDTFERIVPAEFPENDCDTKVFLKITIIDKKELAFASGKDLCSNDDMEGTINLATNFTAFDWIYLDKDSAFTVFDTVIDIYNSGYYRVIAYMDTSLYDTLTDLRIVNCFSPPKDTLVAECKLVIPNVITPNDPPDGKNDVLGIKKLNPDRENELTIHDRWGKIVFQQKNYKCLFKSDGYHNIEDAFKGISRGGQKLPDGTYYYAFKYASRPKSKTYTGVIMIMR